MENWKTCKIKLKMKAWRVSQSDGGDTLAGAMAEQR